MVAIEWGAICSADVRVTSVRASINRGSSGAVLNVRWRSTGAPDRAAFLVTLSRGPELWLAANGSDKFARVMLPDGLAGGKYVVRVLPHAARCTECAIAVVSVNGQSISALHPLGYGKFVDSAGIPHRWFINRAGTLIWDGKPYIPVGLMFLSKFLMDFRADDIHRNEAAFRDDVQRLKAMKEAGVTDLYLNPCVGWRDRPTWVWQRFCDLCEQMGLHYGIQVTQETDQLRFWEINSSLYNTSVNSGETAKIEVKSDLLTSIGSSNAALYVAFDANTGEPVDGGRARVSEVANGVSIEATPKARPGRALIVHFVPERNYEGGLHDYWTCINDKFKKLLDSFFSSLKLGPNMRLWIDPLDNEQGLGGYTSRALPNSTGFQKMFASWLKNKYGGVGKLAEAWGVQAGDYAVFARLVPCGAASDGANRGFAIDSQTGRVYRVNSARSAMLSDIRYFLENSIADFNIQIAKMIKWHHDVPVVLKHEGTDMYTNRRTYGGFDGLGAEAYGTDRDHLRDCSRAVHAQALKCGRTMWELTTETGFVGMTIGYPDPLGLLEELASMVQMGAKGTYCFLVKDADTDPNADWYIFNLAGDPRQFWWLGAYARALKSSATLPDYRPETMASVPERNFIRKILGVEMLELGRALQGLCFGSTTYIWNMVDIPISIEVKVKNEPTKIVKLAPNAARPVVIESAVGVSLGGVDRANLAAALHEWRNLTARAGEIGISVPSVPADDWRKLYKEIDVLRKAIGHACAPLMSGVTIDGDLNEWDSLVPLYVKLNNGVAGSRYEGAKFYVGYDESRLYIAGKVRDTIVVNHNRSGSIWNGDAVEVFIDLHPDAHPSYAAHTADCYQFVLSPTSADGQPAMALFNPGLSPGVLPKRSILAVKIDNEGWAFEAAISQEDIDGFAFKPGEQIGFDIQLDNSDGAERVWSKVWHGTEENFRNRLGFGRLVFAYPRQLPPASH